MQTIINSVFHEYLLYWIIPLLLLIYISSYPFKYKQKKQLRFIQTYKFPKQIQEKVSKIYPHLIEEELNKVIYALRDYFFIANKANGKTVAMPSKVVDVAWHEFIIFTKEYQEFSRQAFGKFFHHTPIEPIKNKNTIDDNLRLTWKLACFKENIIPTAPESYLYYLLLIKFLK